MRTIKKTYTLFSYHELSDIAQQQAYFNWRALDRNYPYASDNCNTLESFCNVFGVVCTRYDYDSYSYSFSFHTRCQEYINRLSGIRLQTYLYNNFFSTLFRPKTYWTKSMKKKRNSRIFFIHEHPLTGFIMDDIILQPLFDFLPHPDERSFKELMCDCLEAFFQSCRDDCEYCDSEEFFKEETYTHRWEYLPDGTLFP